MKRITPGVGLTANVGGQTYNINDAYAIRLEAYDLGIAAQRRLSQRYPGQPGRSNLGGVTLPRFIDLAWTITGNSLTDFYRLRGVVQDIFRLRQNEPAKLTFEFPGNVKRATDVYVDGELLFGERRHTMQRVSGTFVADDPRLYDPTLRVVEYALADPGGLPVPVPVPIPMGRSSLNIIQDINYANGDRLAAKEFPIIVINGPIDNPIIENITTAERIDLTGLSLTLGQYVTVDLSGGVRRDAKTIRNQDGDSVSQFLSTDSDLFSWHLAHAGELLSNQTYSDGVNQIRVIASGVTTASVVSIRYYDRYEGI